MLVCKRMLKDQKLCASVLLVTGMLIVIAKQNDSVIAYGVLLMERTVINVRI